MMPGLCYMCLRQAFTRNCSSCSAEEGEPLRPSYVLAFAIEELEDGPENKRSDAHHKGVRLPAHL